MADGRAINRPMMRLAAWLRADIALPPADDALIGAAVEQGVAPQLFARMRAIAGAAQITAPVFQCAYIANRAQRATIAAHCGEASTILHALNTAGIVPVLMKGWQLGNFVYPDPGDRPMGDLDLLVARGEVGTAEAALCAIGYRSSRTVTIAQLLDIQHELPGLTRAGCRPIELHWELACPERGPAIDGAGVIARSLRVEIDGVPARIMAPEDLLLHVCVHAALEDSLGVKGLCPLLDVQAILGRHAEMDWVALTSRARDWRAERALALTLRLAEQVLNVIVPAEGAALLVAVPQRIFNVALREVLEPPARRTEQPLDPTVLVRALRHRQWLRTFLFKDRTGSRAGHIEPGRRAARLGGQLGRFARRWIRQSPYRTARLVGRIHRGLLVARWVMREKVE